MKNLKKFGAVALAAVMAVTFAPVASLNVFAANTNVDASNVVTADGASIGDGGSYTLKADSSIDFTSSGVTVAPGSPAVEKTVTIDINGQNAKITLNDDDANVIIKNDASLKRGTVPKLDLTATKYKTLTLSGNFELGTAAWDITKSAKVGSPAAADTMKVSGLAVGSTPVAVINSKTYVGQAAITRAEADVAAANASVVAYNGSVSVVDLPDKATASVADSAQAGTKITATADEGLTLQTFKTTYVFKYDAKDASKSLSSGTKTYVDTRYAVGTTAPAAGFTAPTLESDAAKTTSSILGYTVSGSSTVGVGVRDIYNATVASGLATLTIGVDDVYSAETAITYTKGKDWKDDSNPIAATAGYDTASGTNVRPNTYYTQDPTGQVSSADIMLVDGTKYSVTAEASNKTTPSVCPAKSVKVLRSSVWTKEGGNKDASFKFNFISDAGVTVSAPSDMSAAQVYVKTVAGTDTEYYYGNAVWGTDASIPTADTAAAGTATSAEFVYANVKPSEIKTNAAEGKLVVWQIADGENRTVTFKDIKPALTVDRATGIGYYRTAAASPSTAGNYDYTFGTTSVITKDFENKAQGYTENGVAIDPTWKDGIVYASKEIKTTIKVPTTTVFVGEVSQSVKQTDETNKTWIINDGNTNTALRRFVNPSNGEHFYTLSDAEAASVKAQGFTEETSGMTMLPAGSTSGVAVYRVLNTTNGRHLWTTDKHEYDVLSKAAGFKGEGEQFRAAETGSIPVYRLLNTTNGDHLFTASAYESSVVQTWSGWKLEKVAFYSFD